MKREDIDLIRKESPVLAGHLLGIDDHMLEHMTVYTPGDTEDSVYAKCKDMADQIGAEQDPTLLIVDDDIWEPYWKSPVHRESYEYADGVFCWKTKLITIKKSGFDEFVDDQARGSYHVAHELGHATKENRKLLGRRKWLAAALGVTAGITVFDTLQRSSDASRERYEQKNGVGSYPFSRQLIDSTFQSAGTIAAIWHTTSSTLKSAKRQGEFLADKNAAKALPAHVLAEGIMADIDDYLERNNIDKEQYSQAMKLFEDEVKDRDLSKEAEAIARAIYQADALMAIDPPALFRYAEYPTPPERIKHLEKRGYLDEGKTDISR